MTTQTMVIKRGRHEKLPPGGVSVCRPSRFSNPDKRSDPGWQERYRRYLKCCLDDGAITREELAGLSGKMLACACVDERKGDSTSGCHAGLLAIAADWAAAGGDPEHPWLTPGFTW